MENIKLGLIDFGYRTKNLNSVLILDDIINYAVVGEELGYDKFWIGEHHMPKRNLPYNNPTNLIPILASHTKKVSIGTAGTLMCIHNPYHIASSYKFYNTVFPGRIELGFVNGTPYQGTSLHCSGRINSEVVKEFEKNVNKTVELLKNEEANYQKDRIVIPPYKGIIPRMWMFSSSPQKMKRAVDLGVNLGFWATNVFNQEEKDKLDSFREHYFQKNAVYPEIRAVINGICHSSEKRAQSIADRQKSEGLAVCGDGSRFTDFIASFSEFYGINDFMFFNSVKTPKDRLSGIEDISKRMNLNARIKAEAA